MAPIHCWVCINYVICNLEGDTCFLGCSTSPPLTLSSVFFGHGIHPCDLLNTIRANRWHLTTIMRGVLSLDGNRTVKIWFLILSNLKTKMLLKPQHKIKLEERKSSGSENPIVPDSYSPWRRQLPVTQIVHKPECNVRESSFSASSKLAQELQ